MNFFDFASLNRRSALSSIDNFLFSPVVPDSKKLKSKNPKNESKSYDDFQNEIESALKQINELNTHINELASTQDQQEADLVEINEKFEIMNNEMRKLFGEIILDATSLKSLKQ